MKTAIILGANAGQADIIRFLQDNGWYVHACGHRQKGLGVEIANEFHLIDIVDTEAVSNLAKKINPDIVYSISSDIGIKTATEVSEKLNLPHLTSSDIIELFHYKHKIRAYLNNIGLSTVSYNVVNSINSAHSWEIFPCIIKPADSYGQRGITLVKSEKELNKALENALNHSESSHAIIEPYLEGVEISTNVIVQNGEIIINEFTERLVHPLPLLGIPYGHAIPVRSVGEDDLKKAEKIVESLVESLKIENAVLYIQLKVTADGPKIIEVAPRLDGCHLWRLIKQAKGYDLRKYAIDLLIGKKIETDDAGSDKSEKTVLKFHQIKSGERFSAQKLDIPDDVLFNEYRYNENEKVKAVNGKLEVVGYYINRG